MTIEDFKDWEDEVWDYTDDFIKEFLPNKDIIELLTVHWNSIGMKVVFVLNCGQHCTDTFSTKHWIKYYESK